MAVWYRTRTASWPAKAVIAATALAVLLTAAIPAAFVVGLILMILGHVLVGLALFGASVLAALAAVTLAGFSGAQYLRKLVGRAQAQAQAQVQPDDRPDIRVVQLDHSEYDYR
jgi:predicted lipid-binding transport protein (Tim44 family)